METIQIEESRTPKELAEFFKKRSSRQKEVNQEITNSLAEIEKEATENKESILFFYPSY